MLNRIQELITEYRKSIIQSEAEVRSKFIVPLLDILRYPSYLRAEEFPVYGFEGRKQLPAKNADYVLFSDKHFALYRNFSKANIDWVQEHCLLIVEAKKPGELPEVLGQPEYYTIWTKAVAYLAIDGIRVKGYFYNNTNVDYEIIDCPVEDLAQHDEILEFCYDNILRVKRQSHNSLLQRITSHSQASTSEAFVNPPAEEIIDNLPDNTFRYMRHALGRNSEGLSKLQLITRFLNVTDSFLLNDLRYDIPQYMFDIPRHNYSARLYIDNIVFPIETGDILEFYWNENEKFLFESQYIQISLIIRNGKLHDFEIGFRVLDRRVLDRLNSFVKVQRILSANIVRLSLDDSSHREFVLPTGGPKMMWSSKKQMLSMCAFWTEGLEQLKLIEDYYEIEFALGPVAGVDNVTALYDAICFVYDGIAMNANCEINLPAHIFDDDIIIEEPTLFEDSKEIALSSQILHGVNFVPDQTWLLPCRISIKGTNTEDIIKLPCCCRYRIEESGK